MKCSTSCMFCEQNKELFINRSRYHAVCYNHSGTTESFYKCTHCNALVPILPNRCEKCFNPNIFPVTSKVNIICYNCDQAPIPKPKLCDYCEKDQEAFKGPKCDHSLCTSCYEEGFQRCPLCDYIKCTKCERKVMQVADLNCDHQVCKLCFDQYLQQCPLCPVPVKEPEKFNCAKCWGLYEKLNAYSCQHQVCENCSRDTCPVCEVVIKNEKSEEQKLNKEIKSSESVKSEEAEILIENVKPVLSTSEKSYKIEGKEKHKKKQESNRSEIQLVSKSLPSKQQEENDKDSTVIDPIISKDPVSKTEEVNEFNPLLEKKPKKEAKGCKFYSTLFLLMVFYLCTLCFCFSCLCNCFQGFKFKKLNNSLYLFCLCKSKSLTHKLWTSIVKCECVSGEKEY